MKFEDAVEKAFYCWTNDSDLRNNITLGEYIKSICILFGVCVNAGECGKYVAKEDIDSEELNKLLLPYKNKETE